MNSDIECGLMRGFMDDGVDTGGPVFVGFQAGVVEEEGLLNGRAPQRPIDVLGALD